MTCHYSTLHSDIREFISVNFSLQCILQASKNDKHISQDIIIFVDKGNSSLLSYSWFNYFVEMTDDFVQKNITFGEKNICYT